MEFPSKMKVRNNEQTVCIAQKHYRSEIVHLLEIAFRASNILHLYSTVLNTVQDSVPSHQ